MLTGMFARGISVPGNSYDTEVLADSPVAYWKLDENAGGSGTAIVDSSGNSRDCVANFTSGTATLADVSEAPVAGYAGIGRAIDQTNALTGGGIIQITDTTPDAALRMSTGVMTFEFWWNRQGNSGFRWFLFNGTSNGSANCYWEIRQAAGVSQFEIKGSGGSVVFVFNHGIADSVPHHIVLEINAARTQCKYYRDGALVSTNSNVAAWTVAGTDTVHIGFRPDQSARCWLNNIALYNASIGDSRILAHYAARNIS